MVYPILNPIFQPAMRLIEDVILGPTTSIETMQPHLYRTGLIVRILWPQNCGTWQLNNTIGPITVTGASTFTMAVDSTYFDAPAVPSIPVTVHSYPSVVPVGEINPELHQAVHNIYGNAIF